MLYRVLTMVSNFFDFFSKEKRQLAIERMDYQLHLAYLDACELEKNGQGRQLVLTCFQLAVSAQQWRQKASIWGTANSKRNLSFLTKAFWDMLVRHTSESERHEIVNAFVFK